MGAKEIDFVAVNDITDTATLAHLLKYDSVHGRFPGDVAAEKDAIVVGGDAMRVLAEKDPAKLPWKELGVDVVLESTGRFTDRDQAALHLQGGAKKVIISAPAKKEDITIVYGVNHESYDAGEAPRHLQRELHHQLPRPRGEGHPRPVRLRQRVHDDGALATPTTSRSSTCRTRTCAARGRPRSRSSRRPPAPPRPPSLVLPQVKGKIDGVSLRVPDAGRVGRGAHLYGEKATSADEVNTAFREAAKAGPLKGLLAVSEEPLVSVDYIGSLQSSTVDALSTNVVAGTLVNVTSWYDNEMGYSARCVDLLRYVGQRL